MNGALILRVVSHFTEVILQPSLIHSWKFCVLAVHYYYPISYDTAAVAAVSADCRSVLAAAKDLSVRREGLRHF